MHLQVIPGKSFTYNVTSYDLVLNTVNHYGQNIHMPHIACLIYVEYGLAEPSN